MSELTNEIMMGVFVAVTVPLSVVIVGCYFSFVSRFAGGRSAPEHGTQTSGAVE